MNCLKAYGITIEATLLAPSLTLKISQTKDINQIKNFIDLIDIVTNCHNADKYNWLGHNKNVTT